MLTPQLTYSPTTRLLTTTDPNYTAQAGLVSEYRLYAVAENGSVLPQAIWLWRGGGTSVLLLADGSYWLAVARFDYAAGYNTANLMFAGAAETSQPVRVLANGGVLADKRRLYASHAASPNPLGQPFRGYLNCFARSYEARAAFAEGNFALAHRLLT